jgi:hypothetical protein
MQAMSDAGLHKQVESPEPNPALVALKRKIDALQLLYVVLFVASLVLIVAGYRVHTASVNVLWAFALGGAVLVRIFRQSLVRKYNAVVTGGRPAPLS